MKQLLNLVSDRLFALPLLVLYLTDGCNSRCTMCDIWRNPRRNMALDLAQSLADACDEVGLRWMLLSGGEAMQHPQWAEIARMFRQRGIYTMLLTNGLLVQRQAEAVAASVDELIVSLDGGCAETYKAIRGVDGFDVVLDGIRVVRALGVPVATRTTVQRANFREMGQIVAAGKAAGVNHVSFLTIDVSNPVAFGERQQITIKDTKAQRTQSQHLQEWVARAGGLTLDEIGELEGVIGGLEQAYAGDFASGLIAESPAKLRKMVDYFRALNGDGAFPPVRCNAPHISTVVEVNGRLRPCYFLPSYGKLAVGDTLLTALNVPAAQALRQAYRTGQRPECEGCVCSLHKGVRGLLRM